MLNESKKITYQDVRDAITDCFYDAHCADTGFDSDKPAVHGYCLLIVKKIFHDQKVDFDNPDKEGIIKVINSLGEFSKNFRSQDVIEKHQKEILDLLSQV